VEYRLTPKGREVARLVAQLAFWIEENLSDLPAGASGACAGTTGE
jgi:DNA-binding HxlR family transcriptional regulator